MPNICGSSIWPLLLVSILAPRILRYHLDFWEVYAPLGWGMRLATHLCLVPSLRMSRVIPLLPLCFFVACTKTTLLLIVPLPWSVAHHSWFVIDILGQGLGRFSRVSMTSVSWISSPVKMGQIVVSGVFPLGNVHGCRSRRD
jgi:hypothetical protein